MVIGKVRKVLLKTAKRDVFSKIIKNLKTDSFFDFGNYERCYPDNPESITKGFSSSNRGIVGKSSLGWDLIIVELLS